MNNKEILKSFLKSITGNDIMKTNNDNYECVDKFLDSDKYKALKQSENVVLDGVSQQRELLLAYENYTSEIITGKTNDRTAKSLVNDFLANNCG